MTDERVVTTRRVRRASLLLVLVAALAGATAVSPASAQQNVTTGDTNATVAPEMVESSTPDPDTDRLGWENGVWYNATLAVDQSDGITREELQAITARTMARVEYVRGIEFDRTPPVRLITRDQQSSEVDSLAALNETGRTLLNQQYEALFLINETTDAVESRKALLGSGTSGYYDFETRNITMVSPPGAVLRVNEGTLAQELFHAQQDNQFTLPTNLTTIEERNTRNVVVEGDANYVEYRYRQRCDGAWNGTCFRPTGDTNGSVEQPSNLNVGMVQLFLQPYNSGIAFVRGHYESGGWSAVNALYDRYPNSTEQAIHPSTYPDDVPTNISVADRSTDAWAPLTEDGEQVYSSVGEPGLFVSLWYPAFETRGVAEVVPLRAHYNLNESGRIQRPVRYQYNHSATAGWDGDKLVPYRSTDGTNRTGYVYETAWDSPEDAEEFATAYRDLLEYHDGDTLDDYVDTYRLPAESGFGDVVYVDRNGTRVTIVNAQDLSGIRGIRPGGAPAAATDSSPDGTATPGGEGTEATTDEPTDAGASGPGFGAPVAVLAVAAALGLGSRARRT